MYVMKKIQKLKLSKSANGFAQIAEVNMIEIIMPV